MMKRWLLAKALKLFGFIFVCESQCTLYTAAFPGAMKMQIENFEALLLSDSHTL